MRWHIAAFRVAGCSSRKLLANMSRDTASHHFTAGTAIAASRGPDIHAQDLSCDSDTVASRIE